MIAKLTGRLDDVGDGFAILDVGGVGYLVQASSATLAGLPRGSGDTTLHIETVVREDSLTLYGFSSADEKATFVLLTSVQGVGAKVALAILSVLAPPDLSLAIAAQDKAAIARASGVGPKLAQRIVLELKDKVASMATGGAALAAASAPAGAGAATAGSAGGVVEDAVSALVNLGYRPSDAHTAAARAATALGAGADVEAVIPQALKELAR